MLTNPFLSQANTGRNRIYLYAAVTITICLAVLATTFLAGLFLAISFGSLNLQKLPPLVLFILNLLPFPAAIAALFYTLQRWHKRKPLSLITANPAINWRLFWTSGLIWLGLNILGDLLLGLFLTPGNYKWNFSPVGFLAFGLVGVLLIPLQAAAEEIIFRGYFLQGFGLLTRRSWAALLLSSLLFGALHYGNQEVSLYGTGLMLTYYVAMGLLLGFVTLRFLGLEAAIGLHVANNLYSVLFVTFPGSSLPTPALFAIQKFDPLISLIVFLASAFGYFFILSAFNKKP